MILCAFSYVDWCIKGGKFHQSHNVDKINVPTFNSGDAYWVKNYLLLKHYNDMFLTCNMCFLKLLAWSWHNAYVYIYKDHISSQLWIYHMKLVKYLGCNYLIFFNYISKCGLYMPIEGNFHILYANRHMKWNWLVYMNQLNLLMWLTDLINIIFICQLSYKSWTML